MQSYNYVIKNVISIRKENNKSIGPGVQGDLISVEAEKASMNYY